MATMQDLDKAPNQRKQTLSPLMRLKQTTTTGEKVNVCPFGCTADDIDEHGYCCHLVGFTNDGRTMEPMKLNEQGKRFVHGAKKEPVLASDQLVQITVSSRVYRKDVEKKKTA